jgi:DNA-binding transcriptional regulator YhcF (GntR family)
MKLFPIDFKAGVPVYEQVLYAARKAIVSGELRPGDEFPSVRALSAEYKINPNTVQKALMALKNEGLIESLPGVGNRVTAAEINRAATRCTARGATGGRHCPRQTTAALPFRRH